MASGKEQRIVRRRIMTALAGISTTVAATLGLGLVAATPAQAGQANCRHHVYSVGGDGTCVKALQALTTAAVVKVDYPYYLNNFQVHGELARDGFFGPATREQVVEFQKYWSHLEVDGIVGPATWDRLCAGQLYTAGAPQKLRDDAWWAKGYAC